MTRLQHILDMFQKGFFFLKKIAILSYRGSSLVQKHMPFKLWGNNKFKADLVPRNGRCMWKERNKNSPYIHLLFCMLVFLLVSQRHEEGMLCFQYFFKVMQWTWCSDYTHTHPKKPGDSEISQFDMNYSIKRDRSTCRNEL